MQKYRIYDNALPAEDRPRDIYRGTLKAVGDVIKSKPVDERHDMRVELIEVANNADAVESYLNGEQPIDPVVLKRWRGTARGGILELNSDGTDLEKQ